MPGDQGQHGGKAHLEARPGEFDRRPDQHGHRRQSQAAQADRAPPHQHRQHDKTRHRDAAQQRNLPAGQRRIEQGGGEPRHRGDLLARPVQRRVFAAGQADAHQPEHQSDHDHHMQTRNGQQVRQPGIAKRHDIGPRDCRHEPGEQGRADRALRLGQPGRETPCDGLAQPLDPARRPIAGSAGRDHGLPQCPARSGHTGKERIALHIPGARQHGRRWRAQQGADRQVVAGFRARRVVGAQPDAQIARQGWAVRMQARLRHDHALCATRQQFHASHHAADDDGTRWQRFQRSGPPRGDLCHHDAQRTCRQPGQRSAPGRARRRQPGTRRRQAAYYRRQPVGRFPRKGKIHRDTGAHADRQPQGHAVALPVRKPRKYP